MKNKILLMCCLILSLFIFLIIISKSKNNVLKNEIKQTEENSITEQECKTHIEKLASDDLEGRMSGKEGNKKAAEYIQLEFEKYGLPTMLDKFKIKKGINPGPNKEIGDDFTQNIYAWIEGSDEKLKDEIVVIGAHMDHIGYGPSMSRGSNKIKIHNGADDNASGTSVLLEVAQAFSQIKTKRTIVFQAYSGEELGLLGSRHYVDNPKFPISKPDIKKHVVMINLDMVGHLDSSYYYAHFLEGSNSSIDVDRIIHKLSEKYKFAKKITMRNGDGSDHVSFYNKKIPIAFIHTGLHEFYHTPEDDINTLNYKGMELIAKYTFELSKTLANGTKPEFNDEKFKTLSYEHDHGNTEIISY